VKAAPVGDGMGKYPDILAKEPNLGEKREMRRRGRQLDIHVLSPEFCRRKTQTAKGRRY